MNKTIIVILAHLFIITPIFAIILYDINKKKQPNKDLINIAIITLLFGIIYHSWYLIEYIYFMYN
jgi:uncharacterized membrane protein HdeD (DUF308 family)